MLPVLARSRTNRALFSIRDAYIPHDCIRSLTKAVHLRSLSIEFSQGFQTWMGMWFDPDEDERD